MAAALSLAATCAGALGVQSATAPPATADSVRDGQQGVLAMLNVPAAWTVSRGRGVTVAVLDSGVQPAVSDLAGSVATGPDLSGVGTSPSSADWGQHGTWMASIIAGHGHGAGAQDGIVGVAPEARILSIRVIPDRNDPGYSGYEREQEDQGQDSLAQGIRYAVGHGAGVISMSIGYGSPSASVRSALQYAYGHGVAVVAASGNSGDTPTASRDGYAPLKFPADYPGVIGVAAVGSSGTVAGFSSDNLSVEVAAPGVNVSAPEYTNLESAVSLPPLVSPADKLSVDEVKRYSRHLIIPDVGMTGQKRLKNAKVLVSLAPAVAAHPLCSTWPPQASGPSASSISMSWTSPTCSARSSTECRTSDAPRRSPPATASVRSTRTCKSSSTPSAWTQITPCRSSGPTT